MTAPSTPSRSAIQMTELHKSFGRKTVLDGVNLEVPTGCSLVIIGGSGSGKSVTLKCVLGLLKPDSGDIFINGQSTTAMNSTQRERANRSIGMLFQGAALFDSLTVWENIAFGLMQGEGMAQDEARDIAIEKLIAVGMGKQDADRNPSELSSGMQKRVGLARAIAANPEIMFFDEPTTGLDPVMGDVINNLIVECVKELGATALTITHDMASARKISDRIAMLYQGKIIWTGDTSDIDHCGDAYVDQFIHGRIEGPINVDLRAV
jgi:phospholipid/cholesterol/gamma-HCH transport system ATP-binding protein